MTLLYNIFVFNKSLITFVEWFDILWFLLVFMWISQDFRKILFYLDYGSGSRSGIREAEIKRIQIRICNTGIFTVFGGSVADQNNFAPDQVFKILDPDPANWIWLKIEKNSMFFFFITIFQTFSKIILKN